MLHQRRHERPMAAGSQGPQSTLNANAYHIHQMSHCVSRARCVHFPGCAGNTESTILPGSGAQERPSSQGCGWMGNRAIGRALSLPNPSTHGVDLLTTTHGNGSRDCENILKRTALIAFPRPACTAGACRTGPPTLYQAFEEAGNSSLGMDELNQTVTFTAVALSVSSNLAGEPLIEAGDDQGNVLARLTSDDEQQAPSWARWKKARPPAAHCGSARAPITCPSAIAPSVR